MEILIQPAKQVPAEKNLSTILQDQWDKTELHNIVIFRDWKCHYKDAMKIVRYPSDRAFCGTPFDIKT